MSTILKQTRKELAQYVANLRDKKNKLEPQVVALERRCELLEGKRQMLIQSRDKIEFEIDAMAQIKMELAYEIYEMSKYVNRNKPERPFAEEIRDVARACDASSMKAMERFGLTPKGGVE